MGTRLGVHLRGNLVGYLALCVALFAAVGGGAIALPGKNKVDKNDIKRAAVKTKALANGAVKTKKLAQGAVTSAKIGEGSIAAGDLSSGLLGSLKVRWASVNSNAAIISQSGGISVVDHSFMGVYFLDFGVPLANHAFQVTAQGPAGAIGVAAPCAGTPIDPSCSAGDNPNLLIVVITDAAATTINSPFFVSMIP